MKKNFILLVSLLVLITLTTGCGKKAELKDGSDVAVSVKGGKISAAEYYESIKEDNISKIIETIDHKLFDKKYKTDDDEEKEVNDQIEQIKTNYGSNEDTYKSFLRQYFGVETEKELKEVLSLEYKRNEAVEDYVKKHLTDKEIKDYYNDNIYGDVKASHILITLNVKDDATDEEKEEAEEKALKEAKEVITKLNDGEDFKKLAKKYSDDEKTASNGGDLGYFSYDDMLKEFSDATKELKKDEYTKEPVKTELGYHIILKTGEKDKPKLSEVKKDIKETLKEQKLADDATLYYKTLDKIREENKIKWNDDALKKAYNDYMDNLIDAAEKSASSTN